MKKSQRWFGVVGLGALLALSVSPARAELNGKLIGGAEMGVVVPLRAWDNFSDPGGALAPYVGYMFNDYLGWVGQVEILGAPNNDRPGILDDDATWAFSWGGGPRVAVPLGDDVELFGDFQGRMMHGLTPHGSITDSSGGMSTGGGLKFKITDSFHVGAFARWARQYQRVHNVGDVRYVLSGISLDYVQAPPPPPPAPVVAPAPPPPAPRAPAKKIVLRGVNFDFDKSNIRADARPVLDEAVRILKEEGGIAVICEGHTDAMGTDQYNMGLSNRRAKAVRDYLVEGGVSPARIQVEGFGESRPVASNDTADGRAQNRRVELRVQGE